MAFAVSDRVRETTTTTGTGTLDLGGAVSGFKTFVSGIGDGNVTYYAIVHRTSAEFEIGIGTVTDASTDTLSRTTVLSSSNSNSAVTFTAGTKDVFCTQPASKAVFEDNNDDVTLPDDLILGSDSSVLKFGADSDTTLTHTDGTGLTLNSTNKLTFGDAASFVQQSSNGVLRIDGEATVDINASTAVTISNDLKLDSDSAVLGFGADNDITLTHAADTGLTLNGTFAATSVTANSGVVVDNITIDGTEIDLSSGSLTIDVAADIILDADGANVTIKDGGTTTLDIVSNGATDVTLDAPGDIFLDADGGNVTIKDGGTSILDIANNSTDVELTVSTADKNFAIKGTDGSSAITALDIDMALAGKATFSGDVVVTGDLTVTGDDIVMGTNTAGNLLIADGTNFNSVAAGSLSEISTVANDDVFLAVDTSGGGLKKITRSTIVSGLAVSGAAISNVVEDTTPQLGGNLDTNSHNILIDDAHFIGDENGNEQIIFQTTSSAVNQIDITNAATGNGPTISSTGGDTNINLNLTPKGSGVVMIDGNVGIETGKIDLKNGGTASQILFYCESSNAHAQTLIGAPHSEAASNTLTLPSTGGDARLVSTSSTATLTNKTLTTPVIAEIDSGANITLDATADIILDAGGANITFKDDGTSILDIANNSSDVELTVSVADKNFAIKGTDGSSAITALDIDMALAGKATFNDAVVVGGDLTVNGTTTTVNSTTVTIDDPIFTLGGDTAPGSDDNKDRGIEFRYHNGSAAKIGFFGFDDSTSKFTFIADASNSSEVFSGSAGNVAFGDIAAAGDVSVGDDLTLGSDAAVLNFGADSDVSLTHVADTALLLNSSRQLQFGDSGTYIHQSADGVLDLVSDTEIEINATTIDINGNVEISGDLTVSGDDITMGTNTSGHIMVADGTNFNPVAVSGDVSIAANGAVTIANTAVETAMIAADAITEAKIADNAVENEHINDNVISGQTALTSGLATTDELLISDGGTIKRMDVSVLSEQFASAADVTALSIALG